MKVISFSSQIALDPSLNEFVELCEYNSLMELNTYVLGCVCLSSDLEQAKNHLDQLNLDLPLLVLDEVRLTLGHISRLLDEYSLKVNAVAVSALEASVAVQQENERLERAMYEMEAYMNASAVDGTCVSFDNVDLRAKRELVVTSDKIFEKPGSGLSVSGVNTIEQQLPVPLSAISNIQLPGFWGPLGEDGFVTFELKRSSNDQIVASWLLDSTSQRSADGTVSLYLPMQDAAEDVQVKLSATFHLSSDADFYMQLGASRFDKSAFLKVGPECFVKKPLQMRIQKGIPFFRSVPFWGSIHPVGKTGSKIFGLPIGCILEAKQRSHLSFSEFDLVSASNGDGVVVHPISSEEATIAEIDAKFPFQVDGEVRVRVVNQHPENDGVLVAAFSSPERLSDEDLRKRKTTDWSFLAPEKQGVVRCRTTAKDRYIYVLTSIREGDKPAFCWLKVTNVSIHVQSESEQVAA